MKKILLISMTCLVLISSCSARQETACIEPVVNFDFQWGYFERELGQESALPLAGWEKQTSNDQNIQSVELVQQEDGRDFIWASIYSKENSSSSLVRFQPDEKTWESVKSDTLSFGGFSLIKDNNDSIWYIRRHWSEFKSKEAGSLNDVDSLMVGMYKKKASQFQTALKVRDLLEDQKFNPITNIYLADAAFDSENNLWFILHLQMESDKDEYRLLQYSPSTGKIEQKLTDVAIEGKYQPGSLAISSDDTLYLANAEEKLLIRYDLRKDAYEVIDIPTGILDDGFSGAIPLFLNGEDKLWITDYGSVDMSSQYFTWYKIVKSPVFIYQQMGNGIVTWAHPKFLLETGDKRLWYTFGGGTGWVDPGTGQWCVFTTYPSNIVQDSDHNLWIAVGGNLYKHDLEE